MLSWRERGRGGNSLDGVGINAAIDGDVSLPLGPGEWEEALGLPLCVVCQNVSWVLSKSDNYANAKPSLTRSKYWKRNRRGRRRNLTLYCNT